MKRSEMIHLIALTLEHSFDEDNGNWEYDAEKVLDAIEAAGMRPPLCSPTKPIVIGTDKDGNPAAYEYIRGYRNVWEPEDGEDHKS